VIIRPVRPQIDVPTRRPIIAGGYQPWEISGVGAGRQYLLDYALGTFTRTGEASLFDTRSKAFGASGSANWVATNVPRLMADGAIMLEGTRTNNIMWSENFSQWTDYVGVPTLTSGQTAPDGDADAYTIADTSAVGYQAKSLAAVAITGGGIHLFSVWIKKDSTTSRFPAFQVNETAGGAGYLAATLNTSTGVTTTDAANTGGGITGFTHGADDCGVWWRFWMSWTATALATAGQVVIFPAYGTVAGTPTPVAVGSITCWGAQLEYKGVLGNAFNAPYAPIRSTAGAATVKSPDSISFTAAQVGDLLATPFRFTWTPEYSNVELTPSNPRFFKGAGGSDIDMFILSSGGGPCNVVLNNGGVQKAATTLTWSRFQTMEITVRPNNAAALLEVTGATTGDGAVAGTAFTPTITTTLYVGRYTTNDYHPAGVMSKPWRVS
jgi:hypothetical protein